MQEIPQHIKDTVEEIKLRGRAMTIGADLEFLLLKILVACNLDDPDAPLLEYKQMPLNIKLSFAKKALKKNYPELYEEHKTRLNKLSKVVDLRNDMAHAKMQWDENDKSYFKLLIIKGITGDEKPYLEPMAIKLFDKRMQLGASTIVDLLPLAKALDDAINTKFPSLFQPK